MSFDSVYEELMDNACQMDGSYASGKRAALDGTQLLWAIAQQSESWLYGCCPPDIVAFVKKIVDNLLSKFKSLTIVFNGMVKDTPLLVDKNETYASFLSIEGNISSLAFNRLKKLANPPFPNEEFVQALFKKLQTIYADNNNFNIMRAPFFSIAQMAYFLQSEDVDVLIGSVELFCFDNIQSIVVLQEDQLSMSIVDCHSDSPSRRNFIEALNSRRDVTTLTSTLLLPLRHFHTIHALYLEHSKDIDCFVLNLLRACPVLKINQQKPEITVGQFESEMPSRMAIHAYGRSIVLSDLLLLAAGLLPPSVLRTISHGILETPQMLFSPDNKEPYVDEFRNTSTFLTPLHLQIVHQALGNNESRVDIRVPNGEGDHVSSSVPAIVLDEWEIPNDCIGTDWVEKLKELSTKATKTKQPCNYQFPGIATKMKLLDLMGYFTHATSPSEVSSPSVFAEALLKYANQKTVKTAVLFIEACRTKTLEYNPEKKDALMIFATQVLSMFPLRVTSDPPRLKAISVPVFKFNMRLRSVFMALKELNMVLGMRTGTNDPVEFWQDGMIFDESPSPMMGYVAQEILGLKHVTSIEQLKERFPTASHLEEDLGAALDQLKMLCNIAEELSRSNEDDNPDEEPPISVKKPMQDTQKLFVDALQGLLPNLTGKARTTAKYKR